VLHVFSQWNWPGPEGQHIGMGAKMNGLRRPVMAANAAMQRVEGAVTLYRFSLACDIFVIHQSRLPRTVTKGGYYSPHSMRQ
jgi:hypothetical protein